MDQSIQWFPGHMTRTKRKITELLPLVDIVVEVIDARIPLSSRNPDLDALTVGKPRLIVMNKADIADQKATEQWLQEYRRLGQPVMVADCKSGKGISQFVPLIKEILHEKLELWAQKGMVNRAIRAMVVGIPNSGKSSFINRMARGGKAKVEDRPGVTRNQQWFVIDSGAQLLDTPGILWPKFDDQSVAKHLAFTGAIRDEIMDSEELAFELLKILAKDYEPTLRERYKLTDEFPEDTWELLQQIGRKRGMLISGGEVDTLRVSTMLLDEYRGGKLGRITLERPN